MDDLTRAWYRVEFDARLLRAVGDDFQDLFNQVMGGCYPGGDFMPSRPWGSTGDRKNDGYIRSSRTLCAVYAPVSLKPIGKAIRKITDDFDGALPFWEQYFSTWTLVLNDEALPPDITKLILDLAAKNASVQVVHMLRKDLREHLSRLGVVELRDILGPAPALSDLVGLGFAPVQRVLEHLALHPIPPNVAIGEVSPEKLEANGLSQAVQDLLRLGIQRSSLVDDYFRKYHEPTFGERIADAFKAKYIELRDKGMSPDSIFTELRVFAGGPLVRAPEDDTAVLVVLAYLFERCDIYEPPRVTA